MRIVKTSGRGFFAPKDRKSFSLANPLWAITTPRQSEPDDASGPTSSRFRVLLSRLDHSRIARFQFHFTPEFQFLWLPTPSTHTSPIYLPRMPTACPQPPPAPPRYLSRPRSRLEFICLSISVLGLSVQQNSGPIDSSLDYQPRLPSCVYPEQSENDGLALLYVYIMN